MSGETSTGAETPAQPEQQPLLRVVNADATPEQVAAIVAVFSALGSAGGEAPKRKPSEWSATHRKVRETHAHGLGGWKASGLPR